MTTYNTTSYSVVSPQLAGIQSIGVTSTTKQHPIGFTVEAADPSYGTGTFVYGPGVTGTVVGTVVTVVTQDAGNGSTTLGNAQHGMIGVSMSANVGGQYGWYQVSGYNPNVLATGTATAGAVAYVVTGTPGTVSSTSTSNTVTVGLTIVTAVSNGVAGCQLNNPSM